MFAVSLIFSFGLWFVVLTFIQLSCKERVGSHAGWSIPFILGGGLFLGVAGLGLPLIFTSLFLSVFIFVAISREMTVASFPGRSALMVVAGYLATFLVIASWVSHHNEARNQYPFVSLRERLPEIDQVKAGTLPAVNLTEEAEQRLEPLETLLDESWVRRRRGLEAIHASSFSKFVNSPGFGAVRMHRPGPHDLRWDDRESRYIDYESVLPLKLYSRTKPDFWTTGEMLAINPEQPHWETHASSLLSFGYPDYYGIVRDVDHVAGFRPHQFRILPVSRGEQEIELKQLELVSILKYLLPQVYMSDKLPNMENLDESQMRSLTEFESTALERLRAGEDLVVHEEDNEIEMLGSLRALKQCTQCHQVERGTLLGAFSYRLGMK